jgi:hypothetical protein
MRLAGVLTAGLLLVTWQSATWINRAQTDDLFPLAEAKRMLPELKNDPYAGFFWDPLVMEAARELEPSALPPPEPAVAEESLAVYTVPVGELTGGTLLLIAGQPTVVLRGSTVGPRVQLLRLEVTNLDSPYITPSRLPSVTRISDVRLELPVRQERVV